jgi:hypothetical protein
MYPDFKDLFSTLNAEQVKYLVVGGYAVSLHAQPRATKDIDILIKPSKRNAAALFRALTKFGAPLAGLTPDDFAERGSFFRMGTPPVMVDILPEISGVDFDAAWRRRVVEIIDATTGLTAAFISADDLIAAKQAAGPPQDLADVAALRAARANPATGAKTKRRR